MLRLLPSSVPTELWRIPPFPFSIQGQFETQTAAYPILTLPPLLSPLNPDGLLTCATCRIPHSCCWCSSEGSPLTLLAVLSTGSQESPGMPENRIQTWLTPLPLLSLSCSHPPLPFLDHCKPCYTSLDSFLKLPVRCRHSNPGAPSLCSSSFRV